MSKINYTIKKKVKGEKKYLLPLSAMYESFKSLHELLSIGLLFTIIDLRSIEDLISLEVPLQENN